MDAEARRKQILTTITKPDALITASMLAKSLNVSRQIIVGDIALLRAQGHEIIATARGYMIPRYKESGQYLGKVACQHSPENTISELYTIVDLGATIINIIVEHELYGEITGNLNLTSRDDVEAFMRKVENLNIKLLSELTFGIHLHTIACRDKSHFEQVCEALKAEKFAI